MKNIMYHPHVPFLGINVTVCSGDLSETAQSLDVPPHGVHHSGVMQR